MNNDLMKQIEAEREQRAKDRVDAQRYRKIRNCKSVAFFKDGVAENVALSDIQPERLDAIVDQKL